MKTSYDGQLVPQLDEGINKALWKNRNEIDSLMKNAYKNIEVLLNEVL